jgi:hypothetical protein
MGEVSHNLHVSGQTDRMFDSEQLLKAKRSIQLQSISIMNLEIEFLHSLTAGTKNGKKDGNLDGTTLPGIIVVAIGTIEGTFDEMRIDMDWFISVGD